MGEKNQQNNWEFATYSAVPGSTVAQVAYLWQESGLHTSFTLHFPSTSFSNPSKHSQWDCVKLRRCQTVIKAIGAFMLLRKVQSVLKCLQTHLSRTIIHTACRARIAVAQVRLARVDGHADTAISTVAFCTCADMLVRSCMCTHCVCVAHASQAGVNCCINSVNRSRASRNVQIWPVQYTFLCWSEMGQSVNCWYGGSLTGASE